MKKRGGRPAVGANGDLFPDGKAVHYTKLYQVKQALQMRAQDRGQIHGLPSVIQISVKSASQA